MSLKGTDVDPDTATSFLTTFVQSGQDNIQAVAKLDDEIISIERELKQLQDQAAERKGDADGHIAVVLHAKVATTVELRLTYRQCPCPLYIRFRADDIHSRRRRLLERGVRLVRDDDREWPVFARRRAPFPRARFAGDR
jgi:hypothetical protein